jgi:Raf kinase inhibitor-like YbhB/YbcL family protein
MCKIILSLLSCLILFFISGNSMAFTLNSSVFNNGDLIPAKYSCVGQDISPPLSWIDAPSTTQSFVLILDDPDAPAGTWDHWIVFNIPAKIQQFAENVELTSFNIPIGKNSWGRNQYNGPCPPSGSTHRYFFTLYALDTTLQLTTGADKNTLISAMQNHVLATAKLMGKFQK